MEPLEWTSYCSQVKDRKVDKTELPALMELFTICPVELMRSRAGPSKKPRTGHFTESCKKPCRQVYMDCNATTPLEPEVMQAVEEVMGDAWGNPRSPCPAGVLQKTINSDLRRERQGSKKLKSKKPRREGEDQRMPPFCLAM